MNIFEFVPLMKEMSTPTAYAGVGILAFFLVVIFFSMLKGMKQGFWRQLVKTARLLVAAVISFIICSAIGDNIIGMFKGVSFEELLSYGDKIGVSFEGLAQIFSFVNPETLEYILLLPAAILLIPLVFVLLTFLLNTILRIASGIIIAVLGLKKATTPPQKLGGAVLAAIYTIISFSVLFVPISGVLGVIEEAYDMIIESEDGAKAEDAQDQYKAIFVPFTENPLVEMLGACGSDAIYNALSTVKIGEEDVDVRGDAMNVVHIALVDAKALKNVDFSNLTPENKEAINNILESVESSAFLKGILTGVIQSMGNAIQSGVIPIDFGEFGDVMDGVVEYLSTFSADTFTEDLETIKNVYFAVSDSGVLSAMKNGDGNIMELLDQKRKEGDNVLANIIDILKSNQRTSKLITAMTKALVSTIVPDGTQIEVGGVMVDVSYETVKDSVNDILSVKKDDYATTEEFKEELSSTLDTALQNNGIRLEEDVLGGIVDHIDENYDEIYSVVGDVDGELTDEQFNDILLEYYNSYLNSMGGSSELNP